MTLRDALLLFAVWLLAGVIIFAAVLTDGGDYPPAPVELRWQDYRDHNVPGWERVRDAQENKR